MIKSDLKLKSKTRSGKVEPNAWYQSTALSASELDCFLVVTDIIQE